MKNNDGLDKGLLLSGMDKHFVRLLARLARHGSPALDLAAALLSRRTGDGHSCLDLTVQAGRRLVVEGERSGKEVVCPELGDWVCTLEKSGVVGKPGDYAPLVCDVTGKLYLFRYWKYEEEVASFIRQRGSAMIRDIDFAKLAEGLGRLFPGPCSGGIDWQQVAAIAVLFRQFCVITGGPGTGKTTTVAKVLALLLEQGAANTSRIALAAPTGKAAARLQEAVHAAKSKLSCAAEIMDAIPERAQTLHRLLGVVPGSSSFRYGVDNPLPYDIVVIDEASMVDLPLMAKLMAAAPRSGRLILLGDRNQLASVAPGAVLDDICDPKQTAAFSPDFCGMVAELTGQRIDPSATSPLLDAVVELRRSYRFGEKSGIGAVSRAVMQDEPDSAVNALQGGQYADLAWVEITGRAEFESRLAVLAAEEYGAHLEIASPEEAFGALSRFRILCAMRHGPYGSLAVNQTVERLLKQRRAIGPGTELYSGLPVMILENVYSLQLYNGDVGIVLPDMNQDNGLRVFFAGGNGSFRKISPFRLPAAETVYAMTVHKSQGSEFDNVLLILPDSDSPVLTRELLYTALTRAKKKVEVWGRADVFRKAVAGRVVRESGLRQKLWG